MFPLELNNDLQQFKNDVWTPVSYGPFANNKGDDTEEYIKACFNSVDDLSVDSVKLQEKIKDWNSEYHLSPARANLIRSLRLDGMKNILELGSSCGAITRYLGEQGCLVEAVEVNPVQAEITRKRCRGLDNVHVVNASLNDLLLPDDQYDAIFLIGGLENVAMALPGKQNSRENLISTIQIMHNALKSDGILVIATENRMGLKHRLSKTEDVSGKRDINLYDSPAGGIRRTFGKLEWEEIIDDTGIGCCAFAYPFPDYKLPRVLMNDNFVSKDPNAYSLLNRIPSPNPLKGWESADDEFLRWKSLHQSGHLGEFAYSFLIILSSVENTILQAAPFDFVHFSSEGRKMQFRTITEKLTNTNLVVKKSIQSSLEGNVEGFSCISQSIEDTSYKTGVLLTTLWLEACCRKEPEPGFTKLLQDYFTFVQQCFNETANTDFLVDILPFNIVVSDHPPNYSAIDQEWGFSDQFDVNFVLFRAFLWFGYHNRFHLSYFNQDKSWQTVEDFVEYCFSRLALKLQPRLDEYLKLENRIHSEIAQQGLPFNSHILFQTQLQANIATDTKPENIFTALRKILKPQKLFISITNLKEKYLF